MEKSISIEKGKSMIKKISINNFRSHKNTELELCDGVNCIIGLPDSGKTNVIRAINWVLTNRPLGFRFHSDFSNDPTIVSIEFDDGEVTLGKSKSKSIYSHNDVKLEAVGSDVPDIILKQINMSELNIQSQMDKPFLICETSGEVAKIFNRISNLEKPDQAIASITTDINLTNKEIRSLTIKKEELTQSLIKYDKINQMKIDLSKLKEINAEYQQISDEINLLKKLMVDMNSLSAALKTSIDFEKAETELNKIAQCEKKINNMEREIEKIDENIHSLISAKKACDSIKNEFQIKQNEFSDFLKTITICPYCETCKEPIKKHNLDKLITIQL